MMVGGDAANHKQLLALFDFVERSGPDLLTNSKNTMGRTLHYQLLAYQPLPPEIWRVIESVQSAMNERFSWTGETLKLEPVGEEERQRGDFAPDLSSDAPVQAYGFTRVYDDEWNAVLVIRFVKWLSALLPQTTIRVHDEGDYVLCGHLIFEAGEERPDCVRIARQCDYLKSQGLSDSLKRLGSAVQNAVLLGLYYAKFPASDYADRKELVALTQPDNLAGLSLGDAAELMQFPWHAEAA